MIVPGLLLAFSATAAHASPNASKGAPATGAATGQPSKPIDLALRPEATQSTAPLDLAPPPAATGPVAPVDPLQAASAEVKEVVRWIISSGDNTRLPFLLIDKPNARVFAFTPTGEYQGDAPVLLGMAVGDRMLAPNATMSQMPPHTRITPAGRFVSKLAKDSSGKELLVLDYKASYSLHPVTNTPGQRRPERLSSPTVADNRISFGCINVPVPFYKNVVSPAFTGTHGLVYVLPETSPASAMFRFNPVGELASGAQPVTPASNAPAAATAPATAPAPAPAPAPAATAK